MLLKDFYKVNEVSVVDNVAVVKITINKRHEVFAGHFPGNPVTPGVCMIQIVKELTEEVLGEKLFMESCSNVKFMAIINPESTPDLNLELSIEGEGGLVKVKNTTKFDETIALKFSSIFKIV